MNALRAMRDRRSIPALIKRLDDSDSNVQYLALITLSETVGKQDGDFAPTLYLFDKKPQFYLDLWKDWIQKEGDSLAVSPEK